MAKKLSLRNRLLPRPNLRLNHRPRWRWLWLLAAIAYVGYQRPPAWVVRWLNLEPAARPASAALPYSGLPGEPVNWPGGAAVVRGVDVSRYQTHVNWSRVKAAPLEFVFIKATEGCWGRDRLFRQHWRRAGQAGLVRGAYHFYRVNQPAWLQAFNFLLRVDLKPGDLPPVLDVEQIGAVTGEELRANLQTWLSWVEQRYGVKPIIYTNYNFYRDYLYGFFEGYPLWLAHYGVDQLKLNAYDRPQVKFWQHTDRGAVPGIEGRVDCNVFYGSAAELRELCLP